MTKILAFDRDRRKQFSAGAAKAEHSNVTGMRPRAGGPSPRPTAAIYHVTQNQTELVASIVVPTRGRPQLLNRCIASRL